MAQAKIRKDDLVDAQVTLAKMADLAQDLFIGRVSASTGVPETATITSAARTVLDDGSVSDMRTTLGLAIGTDVQAYDADLTTWAGVTPGTGVATALEVNVGSAGAPVTFNGAGGTPSSITLTNATGLPAAGVVGTAATLGANIFTGAQVMSDQLVSRSMMIDTGYVAADKGNSGTATQTYDYTSGSVQTSTCTGAHTVAFGNFPPTGNLGELLVILTNGGAFAITWPGSILWMMPDGTTTSSISVYLAANSGRTSLQASGVDQFLFWSRNAGVTIYGKLI